MRLSTVFELLIIALLVAFAASRVIDAPDSTKTLVKDHRFALRKDRQNTPSRYCTCSSLTCNCCREFSLPVVPVKGPGCATVSYLHDDAMMVTMSFGDRVLRNITINSKKPKPICMGMPGGISKFCGRLYSIKKDGDNFKACLGLELRALDDVEAALRVSCFKFGPNGVNVEPGEAIPEDKIKEEEDEDDDDYGLGALDDDDDDDDDFGLSGGEDDDDDEDDERPPAKDTTYNDVDSSDSDADDDYTGFGYLSEELLGGLFGSGKRKPIINFDDDDDEDDEDDDDNVPEPPKIQPQTPAPQVNVVVMQPVVLPAPTVVSKRPGNQKRPVKVPSKVNSTRPLPLKRVRPTTASPVKRVKTTPAPVKFISTTTTPPVVQVNNVTTKQKKRKKPVRRRRPPVKNATSTEPTPTVVTETTMTVNVVQAGVVLNKTHTQTSPKPAKINPLKIPMSKPVIQTKPVEPVKQFDDALTSSNQLPEDDKLNNSTEKLNTETNEITTQTIMQNTIPIDGSIDDILHSQKLSIDRPASQQNDDVLVEGLMPVSTTPSTNDVEDSTYQDTTVQEAMSYTNDGPESTGSFEKATTVLETETTEKYKDITTIADASVKYELKGEGVPTTVQDSMAATQVVGSTTAPYEVGEEGTDKTEAIIQNSKPDDTQETSSNEEDETEEDETEDDENEDDDDDDDDEIEFEADLGLDDDDDEEEETEEVETEEKGSTESAKPEDKEEVEVDLLGGILDDDEEEDDGKTEEENEARNIGNSPQYKINPLLYRLARVSSGSIATARHLPRFSEGRNRRNNKRMRFPSLEITP